MTTTSRQQHDRLASSIDDLLEAVGADTESFEASLVRQMIRTVLKLIQENHDTGQLKLINSALKEMRYAYRVFNDYRDISKITIFGSARTPPKHRDYEAARQFSKRMSDEGWMSITGAGDGIMKAGHEGPGRGPSFGLSIRLPFETTANTVIEGDPKLINFRYFFTRKLMFMTHAHAVAVFPGGFGTQDELFESLTLVQTGKSNIIPIVLIDGDGGGYWRSWERYVSSDLLGSEFISPEDPGLYHIAQDIEDAVQHVLQFYRRYHSSRYVREILVIRLKSPLSTDQIDALNDEFADALIESGCIEKTGALEGETDHLDLPRIAFHHNRKHLGLVRRLIDRVNTFE